MTEKTKSTNTHRFEVRDENGRLLFFIIAYENYYSLEEQEKEPSIDNYDYRSIEIYPSFPETIFFRDYGVKEYIKEIEEKFEQNIICRNTTFDSRILVDLAQTIELLPGIKGYYFPDFILSSLDEKGDVDFEKLKTVVQDDTNTPWIDLAASFIEENQMNYLDEFNPWVKMVLQKYLHPLRNEVYFENCKKVPFSEVKTVLLKINPSLVTQFEADKSWMGEVYQRIVEDGDNYVFLIFDRRGELRNLVVG